jgi:ABC-2 type transport system ATP-binding protein
LAKALLNQPDLLLLDEPTASLDPESEEWALHVLEEYRARTGCSVVIATHNMDEVQRLCTDVVVLGHGRIVEHGTTANLLARYEQDSLRPVFLDIASNDS